MSMDINHVAKLAKLRISAEEAAIMEEKMQEILHMVEHLPPLEEANTLSDDMVTTSLRKDIVRESVSRELLLDNAPQVKNGCFVVPKVVQ